MPDFRLERMPFDIGFYRQRPAGIPEYLPFELVRDPKNGLIRQNVSEELRRALKSYYGLGGYLSTPLGEGEFATAQGDFFLRALELVLGRYGKSINGLDFLEIGAAYGYILHGLLVRGAKEAIGVEPGEEGIKGSRQWDVPIIKDFFPTPKLEGRQFDVALSHCVLEHVEDPLALLQAKYTALKPGGLVFVAVPGSEEKMSIGDLSIVTHQHINYFTKTTIRTVLAQAGFSDIGIITSSKRSILMAWGLKKSAVTLSRIKAPDNDLLLRRFSDSFTANVHAIQNMVDILQGAGKTVGLYAPDANLAGLISYDSPPRIFNTDAKKHGMYVVSTAGPFEPPENLISNPVDAVLVAPVDYDEEIRTDLKRMGIPPTTQLISLKELYQKGSATVYRGGSLATGEELSIEDSVEK